MSYTPVSTGNFDEEGGDATTNGGLNQNLVGLAAGQTLKMAQASRPTMQVVAPATLPEGYQFDAKFGDAGQTIKVCVPPGGVEEGQTFTVPLPERIESMITGISIPVGHWRDGICDLFSFGCCHPSIWTACCCAILAGGQIIARLRLTVCGSVGPPKETHGAFAKIFILVIIYAIIRTILGVMILILDPNDLTVASSDENFIEPPPSFVTVEIMINLSHYLFYSVTVALIWNIRRTVRSKYAIPGQDHEDAICSCFCPCLVAAQMLRHTTDYETYPATCCTERGIPKHAPSIV